MIYEYIVLQFGAQQNQIRVSRQCERRDGGPWSVANKMSVWGARYNSRWWLQYNIYVYINNPA